MCQNPNIGCWNWLTVYLSFCQVSFCIRPGLNIYIAVSSCRSHYPRSSIKELRILVPCKDLLWRALSGLVWPNIICPQTGQSGRSEIIQGGKVTLTHLRKFQTGPLRLWNVALSLPPFGEVGSLENTEGGKLLLVDFEMWLLWSCSLCLLFLCACTLKAPPTRIALLARPERAILWSAGELDAKISSRVWATSGKRLLMLNCKVFAQNVERRWNGECGATMKVPPMATHICIHFSFSNRLVLFCTSYVLLGTFEYLYVIFGCSYLHPLLILRLFCEYFLCTLGVLLCTSVSTFGFCCRYFWVLFSSFGYFWGCDFWLLVGISGHRGIHHICRNLS